MRSSVRIRPPRPLPALVIRSLWLSRAVANHFRWLTLRARPSCLYLNPYERWKLPAALAGHQTRVWASRIDRTPATREPVINALGFTEYRADRIKYYSDPLDRLVALHRSDQEMTTGLVHESPFERADARFR